MDLSLLKGFRSCPSPLVSWQGEILVLGVIWGKIFSSEQASAVWLTVWFCYLWKTIQCIINKRIGPIWAGSVITVWPKISKTHRTRSDLLHNFHIILWIVWLIIQFSKTNPRDLILTPFRFSILFTNHTHIHTPTQRHTHTHIVHFIIKW